MNAFKKTLIGSAGVVVLSVVVALSGVGQAIAENPSSVLVTNSPSQPVPVIGNVTVNNPATNPVRVAPQGTTNVAGSVTVGNAATSPVQVRDVDNPALNAVTAHVIDSQPAEIVEISGTAWYSVPSGKRLAIQYVGGSCGTGVVRASLVTHRLTDGLLIRWPLRLENESVGQQVTVYAEGGSSVRIAISTGTTAAGCQLQFSGYLVPAS
jgi:hypothetical protein